MHRTTPATAPTTTALTATTATTATTAPWPPRLAPLDGRGTVHVRVPPPRRVRRSAVTATIGLATLAAATLPAVAGPAAPADARVPLAQGCAPSCPPVRGTAYGTVAQTGATWVVQPSYNSAGGTNTVVRTAAGQYTVTLPVLSARGVTNLTGDSSHCTLASSTSTQATGTVLDVRCWGTADQPEDSEFSFLFTSRRTTTATSTGFAYAEVTDSTGPTSTPVLQHSSAGGTITVAHPKPGAYTVKLPWLGFLPGKAAHVTAVGSSAWCSIASFGLNPKAASEQWVKVRCLDAAGLPVDTGFMFDFLWSGDQGHGSLAYTNLHSGPIVDLGSDHSGTVHLAPAWLNTSAAQAATWSRSFKGVYTVHLKGFATVGTAQVSAVGTGKARCATMSVSATSVGVRCAPVDNPAGFVDTPFLLQYTTTG